MRGQTMAVRGTQGEGVSPSYKWSQTLQYVMNIKNEKALQKELQHFMTKNVVFFASKL